MALTTVSKLKTFLKVTDFTNDEYYQVLLDSASSHIENYCKRKFAKATGIEEYLTTNSSRILTLKRTPVWEVTSVKLDYNGRYGQNGGFGSDTLLVEGENYYLDIDSSEGLSYSGRLFKADGIWLERSPGNIRGHLYNPNIPAYGNVLVVYTGGYDPIPDDLQNATIQLASVSAQLLNGAPRTSERLGNGEYRLDFSVITGTMFQAFPLLGSARQILSSYRQCAW